MIVKDFSVVLVFIFCIQRFSFGLEVTSFSLTSNASPYHLKPGTSLQLQFNFNTASSNTSSNSTTIIFSAKILSYVTIDASSAVINTNTNIITFTLTSAVFNGMSFGDYNCRFCLYTSSADKKCINLPVSYEEPIANFKITCNNFQKFGVAAAIAIGLNSGSNINMVWYANDVQKDTITDYGNGTRQIQHSLALSQTGQVNISVTASNTVSTVVDSVIVNNYYPINGFSVTSTPGTPSSDAIVYVNVDQGVLIPQGSLSPNISYGDGTFDIRNSSSPSNLVLYHRYSSIGSYFVSVKIASPVDSKTYTTSIGVYNPISSIQVDCSSYQKIGVAVTFNITIPSGSNITLKWYLNTVFSFQTIYESHGSYVENRMINKEGTVHVTTVASNAVSQANHSLTFINIHGINGITLSGDETVLQKDAVVTLKLTNAALLPQGPISITINFGDSSPLQIKNISWVNESSISSGVNFTHQFSAEMNYTIQAHLTSPVDAQTFSSTVQVMEPITDIQISCSKYQKYGIPIPVTVNLTNGYNVKIIWLVNDNAQALTTTFHAGKGIRTFSVDVSPTRSGYLNLTALASNAVSESSSSVLFSHLFAINGFTLTCHPSTLDKDASIIIKRAKTAGLPQGKILISVQFGDGNSTSQDFYAGDDSFLDPGYDFSHRYLTEGQYNVIVNITSYVDFKSLSSTVDIIEPIQNISVLSSSEYYIVGQSVMFNLTINYGLDVKTKWYVNGKYKYSLTHAGKGRREIFESYRPSESGKLKISINASNPVSFFVTSLVIYNYYELKGYSISCAPGTIYEDVKIILSLASGSRLPQGLITFEIQYGDGLSATGTFSSTDRVLKNSGKLFPKRYLREAFYIISVTLSSPVDTINLTSEVKIVEPIQNIAFWTKLYHEIGEELVIYANLTKGYNTTTTWQIGTTLSHVILHEGTGDRYFNFTKMVSEKGAIDLTVTATNLVSEMSYTYKTYYYHKINNIHLTSTVSSTVKDAKLYFETLPQAKVPQGNIDVLIYFGDGTTNTTYFALLSTTLTDLNHLITHLYEHVGNYTVTASLTSPLGIDNITAEVEVIEPIFEIEFECERYLEIGQELIISATLFGGMRAVTEWSIGTATPIQIFHDGNGTRTFDVRYNVTDIGSITVTVNAVNDVSQATNSTTVFYLYPLNGFNVSHGIHSTLEEAEIKLTLWEYADLPMGLITVITDFGDGQKNITVINGSDSSFSATGLLLRHSYTEALNFSVVVTLISEINSINLTSEIKILEPIYGIEFMCPKYVEVSKEIVIKATLFGGHEVTTQWFFGNRSKVEEYHFGNGTREFIFTHNVSGSGEVNITVQALSPVSVKYNSTVVFYYYGVNGFLISDPQTASNYNKTDVSLWLDSDALKPMGDISISLMFGDGNVTKIEMDSNNRSLEEPGLVFSHMYQMFGDYIITAQITSHINSVNYSTGVELLEPAEGIEIECQLFNVVGNTLAVSVKLKNGTKLQVVWDFGGNVTAIKNTSGSGIRSYHFDQSVQSTGEINVTVEASNTVSSVRNWTIIYYYFEVNGFYFDKNSTVQTNEIASIFFKISKNAYQPQGIVDVYLSFGDGNSTSFNVSSEDSLLVSDGMYFEHIYPIQGVYQIMANITSHVGRDIVSTDIKIWDKIDVELNSTKIAQVGEFIHFDFVNVPNSNFRYFIEYGDGQTGTNEDDDLYRKYDFGNWTKAYNYSSLFTVTLKAWNPLYEKTSTYQILVEHPLITDIMTLSPENDTIPIPDGLMSFTLNVSELSSEPSNVICTFDYGTGEQKHSNVTVHVRYSKPLIREYVFQKHGLKNVTFYCHNSVSSIFKSSIVNVLKYDLQDIKIFYKSPVNMNMTLVQRTPSPENRHPYEPISIPVNVLFSFYFLGCSRLPFNLEMIWDFDDNTPSKSVKSTKLYYSHTFEHRGIFKITLKIIDNNTNTFDLRNLDLQTGTLDFSVSPDKGDLRNTVFNLTAVGLLGENSKYTFYADTTEVSQENFFVFNNVTDETAAWAHVKYLTYGYFIPRVTGSNESLVETVYWNAPIIADLSIETELTLHVPDIVPLPPGTVEYKISIPTGTYGYRPYVFCTIITGDEVDRSQQSQMFNITSLDPLIFRYTYIAIGYPELNINCENSISTRNWKKHVTVSNLCFEVKGIFDRQYSMIEWPMPVWTSANLSISNRMGISANPACVTGQPVFEWEVHRVNESGVIDINSYSLYEKSNNGILFIEAGKLEPGLYYLNLTVNITTTFIFEYMYIRFLKPEPFAYIIGGSKTTIRPTSFVLLDALEKSHIANSGFGNTNGLNFSWKCEENNAVTAQVVQSDDVYNGTTSIAPYLSSVCPLNDYSRGIAKLSIDGYVDAEFAVTVTVFENSSHDEFTQIISVNSTSPELAINCTLNCGQKVTVTTKVSFLAWCKSCEYENTTLSYNWTLLMKTKSTHPYELVEGFSKNTTTGTNIQALAISPGFLVPGILYRLTLNACYLDGEGEAEVFAEFATNFPPYGGSCNFSTETRESSINKEYIQAGDESFNHIVHIVVKIFDLYGDFTEVQSDGFEVPPPSGTQPSTDNDLSIVRNLRNDSLTKYNERKLSGNEMSAIRLLGSTASAFKNISNVDTTTTEHQIMTGVVQKAHIDNVEIEIVKLYQNFIAEMLYLLRFDLHVHCSSNQHRYSLADLQQILSTVDAITRIQPYITFDIVKNTTQFLDNLVLCFDKVSALDPFPVENVGTTDEIAKVIHRIINRLLDVMLPDHLQDHNTPIVKADIKEILVRDAERQKHQEALLWAVNVSTLIDYTDLDNKADMLVAVRQHYRSIQEQQVLLAGNYFPMMQQILRRMQNVILRTIVLGERHIMERTVVSVITEKITVDSIENRTDEYFVGIQPSNGTFEQLTDVIVAMKINYFSKNPFIYGKNASALTSGVSTFDIGDDIKLDVKLANNGNFKYQKFIPLINPEYPEKMIFFTFDVINDDDAAIIFMNPDGFDINNPVNFTLYTFYVSSETYPTSTSYDFIKTVGMRDWEDIGFKIFLQQGLCAKGTCYLGVKPEIVPDYSGFTPTRMRRKREASLNQTTPAPTTASPLFIPVQANFSLVVFTTGCRSWNDSQGAWSSDGCTVLEMSSVNDTVCRCSGNTFSTTFYVPPNMIDFLTVFKKFDATNAYAYGPVIGLFVIYVIAAIFLRREDVKDLTRWAAYFLVDHDAEDKYFYLLTVQTGMRRGAGTKSNVNFVLVGNEEDSDIRVLSDGVREGFSVASINRYFMGTKEPLGDLRYLRIWHDNSGEGTDKNWYLNRVIVDDLQEKDRYVFLCEKWLSLDEDDGMIERVLPVSTKENLNSFKTLMNENSQLNVTDHHLWVSLLLRPNISRFTRVQRLATLMTLLLLIMISNAMFFRSSTEDASSLQVEIGFLRFSLSTLYVSVIGVIITTPPILFVIIAFRKSKLRKRRRGELPKHTDSKDYSISAQHVDSKSNYILQALNEDIMFADSNLFLPFWTVYVAWVVLVLAAAASSFFLILYSMEWGKEKSEEWLTSFLLSFLESFLFIDPLKVVFVSLLFATIFKSIKEEKPPLIDTEELRKASVNYNGDSRQSFLALVNNILKKNEPPSEEELKIVRQKRQEEKRARRATYNILIYSLYIFVLYSASYLQRDLRSFNLKWNLDNYLIANSGSQLGFSAVNETLDFIAWINRTLIPTFYPENDYRGQPLSVTEQKWFGDRSSIRVGPARLRQLRGKREICKVWSITWPRDCVEKYAELEEEKSSFCIGWNKYNETVCSGNVYENIHLTANAWKYTDAKDIWGFSILGDYNMYSGGGYILEFTKNREQAVAMLNELIKYYWINRATRAIFMEFTVYNPNANLFAYAMFLCEYPETGGTLIWTDTQSFRPVLSSDEVGAFAILSYIVIIAYLIGYLIHIIVKSATKGCCKFFKVPWNIVDFLITLLGFACIAIYIVRYIDAKKAMQMYSDDILSGTNRFINFGHIVFWDNLFNALFSTMVFISTIKVLRILGYNRKFTEIISVVTNAAEEIAGFSVVFIVMFSSFVLFGYFLFGVHLQGYKSVFATCSTLANTFIGKNKLDTLMAAAPKTAQFYYFTYMVCVIMTLLTMFAAILNKSIADVKAEHAQYVDTIGITDIFWKSAKNFLSMFFKFGSKSSISESKEGKENLKKLNAMRNGSVEVSNVLALIRHTFNDFSDIQEKKSFVVIENSKKHYHSSDHMKHGEMHELDQSWFERDSQEADIQRNFNESKMQMYL